MKFESLMAENVFKSKYLLENETTADEVVNRVANALATIYPEIKEETKDYMNKNWFVFGGSVLRAAGNPNKNVSFVNCTTLKPVDDNLEDIFDSLYRWAKYAAFGQGEGIDISNLRPKGAKVHNSSRESTGAVSFVTLYDKVLKIIAQQGRRGASLISIKDTHPDIFDFITLKDKDENDESRISTANLSIQISDEFMEAVIDNTEWTLRFENKYEVIENKVMARDIFNEICRVAHKRGDPGLQFIDTWKYNSNSDAFGYPLVSSNACFRGDTMIAVADGRNSISIKQLAEEGQDVPVYSVNQKTGTVEVKIARNPRKTGENKRLVKIILDDDSCLYTTENHKFLTKDGRDVEAKNLVNGDSLPRFNKVETAIKKGGKKYYRVRADTGNENIRIFEHRLIAQHYFNDKWNILYDESKKGGWISGGIVVHHKDFNGLNNSPDNLEIMSYSEHRAEHNRLSNNMSGENNPMFGKTQSDETKKLIGEKAKARFLNVEYKENIRNKIREYYDTHPEIQEKLAEGKRKHYLDWCNDFIENTDLETTFINGLLFVNKICEHCGEKFTRPVYQREVSYCSASCAQKEKDMTKAHNTFAEKSKQTLHKQIMVLKDLQDDFGRAPLRKEWENACKEKNIPRRFQTKTKNPNICGSFAELKQKSAEYNHRVKSVEITNLYEDVYNLTVDENHTVGIITNNKNGTMSGVFTTQCGEIPNDENNICMLGHINLDKFDEYGKEGFKKLIRYGVKALNACRLLEYEDGRSPIKEQREKLLLVPRIGLGHTGFADYLISHKVRYGSEESIKVLRKLHQIMVKEAFETSYELADKYGSFTNYNKETMMKSGYIKRLLEEGVIDEKVLDKQFNIQLFTLAPVGSGSIIANTGGSGIEPLFSKYFVRRERSTTKEWKEWFNFNACVEKHLVKNNLEVTRENANNLTDDYWVFSYDVDPYEKIKLVSEAQKWIDSSISVTFNLPEESTQKAVENIYIEAWKNKLKGVTVYREGSLTGILITEKNYETSKLDKVRDYKYKKRPDVLPCDIYHLKYKKQPLIILIGLSKDGKPYEVFVSPDTDDIDPNKHKEGFITKHKTKTKSYYSLEIENGETVVLVKDIAKTFDSMYGTLSRFISMSLREGIALQFIVEQLNKDSGFVAFERSLSRVLKRYISDNTTTRKVCPDCGEIMVYMNGCISCVNSSCGFSKCD